MKSPIIVPPLANWSVFRSFILSTFTGALLLVSLFSFVSTADASYSDRGCDEEDGCATIYVDVVNGKDKNRRDGSSSDPYQSIQFAIDQFYAIDVPDMYGHDVRIVYTGDKTVNEMFDTIISSKNPGTFIIDGQGSYTGGLHLNNADNVVIEDLNFGASSSYPGFINFLSGTSYNITIQDCGFYHDSFIYLAGSGYAGYSDKTNINIKDNTFTGDSRIFLTSNAGKVTIENNTFSMDPADYFIEVQSATGSSSGSVGNGINIRNNSGAGGLVYANNSELGEVTGNSYKTKSHAHNFAYFTDTNVVSFSENLMYVTVTGLMSEGSTAYTIDYIRDNSINMHLGSLMTPQYGLVISNADVDTISGNTIDTWHVTNPAGGMYLYGVIVDSITNNNFIEVKGHSILATKTYIDEITGNYMKPSVSTLAVGEGIVFWFDEGSTANIISDNDFDLNQNKHTAIYFSDSSSFDEITKNDFHLAYHGIIFEDNYGDFENYYAGESPMEAPLPDTGSPSGNLISENDFQYLEGVAIGLSDVIVTEISNNNFEQAMGVYAYISVIDSISNNTYFNLGTTRATGQDDFKLSLTNLTSFSDNNFTEAGDGGYMLAIENGSNVEIIEKNHFENETQTRTDTSGVLVENSAIGVIQDNEFIETKTGVSVEDSSTVSGMGNNLFGASLTGIYIDSSKVDTIFNSIFRTYETQAASGACGAIIRNFHYGIHIDSNVESSSIANNTFFNDKSYMGMIYVENSLATGSSLKIVNNVFDVANASTSSEYWAIAINDPTNISYLDYNLYNNMDSTILELPSLSSSSFEEVQAAYGHDLSSYSFSHDGGVVDVEEIDLPLLIDTGAAAIDAANASYGKTYDFNNNPRSVCMGSDMGANENQYDYDGDGDGLCAEDSSSADSEVGGGRDDSTDSDADDLDDYDEVKTHTTDPGDKDTDSDDLEDGEEVNDYSTNPLLDDTDGDGVTDGDEVRAGSDPLINDVGDTDGDGVVDYEDYCPSEDATGYDADLDGCIDDTDGDGVYDDVDACADTTDYSTVDEDGCSESQIDSDGDTITDDVDVCPLEDATGYDADLDGCIDDSDGDGVYDDVDACPSEDATDYDTDSDGCIDDTDGDGVYDDIDACSSTTDYSTVDADGCSDEQRDSDGDTITDDVDACPSEDATGYDADLDGCIDDFDGDGLYADEEDTYGSSDSDTDSDDDGLDDYEEVHTYGTDPMDDDTDNDDMDDEWEVEYGFDPVATDESGDDEDGDGLTNLEEYELMYDPTLEALILHDADDVTSCAPYRDGTNIATDTSTFVEGAGSVSFDVDVSRSSNDSGLVDCSYDSILDFSDYVAYGGTAKFWVYIPDATNFTEITLMLASGSSGYSNRYEGIMTAPINNGGVFQDGWNLMEADFSTFSSVGSPDATDMQRFGIIFSYDAAYTDQTGFRFDALVIE